MEQAVNQFLEGIIGDRTPLDSDPNSLTDAVNATVFSNKGDQVVQHIMRSVTPVVSGVDKDTRYTVASRLGRSFYLGKRISKIKLEWVEYDLPVFRFLIEAHYGEGDFDTVMDVSKISDLPSEGEHKTIALRGEKLERLEARLVVPGGDRLFCYLTLTNLGQGYTGIPAENKVLGVKVFNDIAYIVSGVPNQYQAISRSCMHAQRAAYQEYLAMIGKNPRAIGPDRYSSVQVTPSKKVNILAENTYFANADVGRINRWEGHERYKTVESTYKFEKEGNYTFELNGKAWIESFNDGHIICRFRAYRNGAQITGAEWEEESHGSIVTFYKKFFTTYINPGDKISLYGYLYCNDKGKYKLRCTGGLWITNSPRIVTDTAEKIKDFSGTGLQVKNASNNLSTDGGFTFSNPLPNDKWEYEVRIDSSEKQIIEAGKPFGSDKFYFYPGHGFPSDIGLPAGDYMVEIRYVDKDNWVEYRRSEVITIGAKKEIPPLKLTTKLKGFKGLEKDFEVELTVEDAAQYKGIRYRFGYSYRYKSGDRTLTKSESYLTTNGQCVLKISAPGEDISLVTWVMEEDQYPGVIVPSKWNSSSRRKCDNSISIYDELSMNRYKVEIGTFPSPGYGSIEGKLIDKYIPLQNYNSGDFISERIFLSGENYLDMEIQQVYDDSVNILFAEPGRQGRCINSGFAVKPSGKYVLRNEGSEKSTNKYTSANIEVKSRLIQSTSRIPEFICNKVNPSGGNLEVGTYQYYIRFGTVDGNETGILAETGLIPIMHGVTMGTIKGGKGGDSTSNSIEFKISNIDVGFNHVSLYYVLNTGDNLPVTKAFKVKKSYIIPSKGDIVIDDFIITHTGFEPVQEIPEGELSEIKEYFSSVKTLVQVQDRLFVGNVSSYDIDYNKLTKVGRRICALPSIKTDNIVIGPVYDKWGHDAAMADFHVFSQNFFSEKLHMDLTVFDPNKPIRGNEMKNFYTVLNDQGFHNPLYTANMTGYWPMETYKFGVCFVLEGEIVTRPVPVLGADYSNYKGFVSGDNMTTPKGKYAYKSPLFLPGVDNDYRMGATANKIRDELSEGSLSRWCPIPGEGLKPEYFEEAVVPLDGALHANNMGVVRFPNRKYPNQQLFVKFNFDLDDLRSVYPEFFSRVKGMFFVRAERRPDSLMEGAVLGTKLVPTISREYMDNPDPTEITTIQSGGDPRYSAVPYLSNKASGENLKDYLIVGVYDKDTLGNCLTKVSPEGARNSFLNGLKTAIKIVPNTLNKWAFYSGDLIPLLSRASASFNGQSFGAVNSTWTDVQTHEDVFANKTDGYAHVFMRFASSWNTNVRGSALPNRVTAELIRFGRAVRSGAGFASQIPYLVGKFTHAEKEYFPTGNYPTYIGLVGTGDKHDYQNQNLILYPSAKGPITLGLLKDMYNADELGAYKTVTPVYTLKDIGRYMRNGVLGARGDCFITLSWHNVARTLPAIGLNPTTDNPEVKSNGTEGTSNGYNAGEASLNIMALQASNYLNFARHNEVVDEVETAIYGKARGFLPTINADDYKLHLDQFSKLPESESFNQGYKAHFTGRMLYNVSADTPFVNIIGGNTIAFSEKASTDAYYNAFRDFYASNSEDYNKELGGITKLVNYYNNLLVVHEKGVTLIGVNDQTVVGENTGGKVYTDSARVLNPKAKILSNTIGSRWIRSICPTDNSVYGVDAENFKIWAVKGEGLQIISTGKVNKFLAGILKGFKGSKEVPGELYIATFYDSQKGDVTFTFYNKKSTYTEYPLPMDIDEFYLMEDMGEQSTREDWAKRPLDTLTHGADKAQAIKVKDEVLRRNRMLQQYERIKANYKKTNHITLVFNEHSRTWTTRLSHSPEFAFNVKNSFYSINNKEYSGGFSGHLEEYKGQKLLWDHNGINEKIPTYGSMYGSDPVFEIEFVINPSPMYKKLFKSMTVIGNEAVPEKVIYTLPDSCPWLNILKETKYHTSNGYLAWEDIKEGYLDKLNEGEYPATNPFALIEQAIYDRRNSPIFKANYRLSKTNNIISIGKNMTPMYWGEGNKTKDMTTNFADKWIKVRIRYTSGEYVYLKSILTEYNILH